MLTDQTAVWSPPKQLPGESHAQREHEQDDAGEPVSFAWEFISRVEKHPQHMNADEQDHGGGAKVVQTPYHVAERGRTANVLQTLIGTFGGRGCRRLPVLPR